MRSAGRRHRFRPAAHGRRISPFTVESQRVVDNFGKPGGNPLIPGDAYRVQTDRRTANGNIEIHEKETDIFYIMDGATIVVGGRAVDPKPGPGQMTAKEIEKWSNLQSEKRRRFGHTSRAAALVQTGQRVYQLLDG